jgi:membrane protein YqaA with SNARE-associated domain
VPAVFASIFGYFLSPVVLLILAALDSSMLFFLPMAVDTATIILCARQPHLAIVFPLLATAGSLLGNAGTYWIGRRVGEPGLERFASQRRLEDVKRRLHDGGAFALAVPALLPPPFPLTPFVLTCGALEVSRTRFFAALAVARLMRFGVEAALAVRYGSRILVWIKSDVFKGVIIFLAVTAVIGTAVGIWSLMRKSPSRSKRARRSVA